MNMIVSGVSEYEGTKRAYVRFEEGNLYAEGTIPDCKIQSSEGFSDDELEALSQYMRENLEMLKRKAAECNPIRAMMKDGTEK